VIFVRFREADERRVFCVSGSAIANAVSAPIAIGKTDWPDHPWIEKQAKFAKTLTSRFAREALSFYTVFSPATY
jgi:hypothetical protein